MPRNARYEVLDDENTEYNNYHELNTLHQEQATAPHPLEKPSEYEQAGGNRLQRFYIRAFVGILGPFVVCAYFIAIWRLYIVPVAESQAVLGLGLNLYSLAGVEASMLMEPTWSVGDATRLMLHADTTWSGPGGWLKTIKWAVTSRNDVRRRSPSLLWFVLAVPSMLGFIAWTLSGLTMEVTEGYLHAHTVVPANKTGFSYGTFNERGVDEAYTDAALTWSSGQVAKVPGKGIVYTQEGLDRSTLTFINRLPVAFPKDDGNPTLFLAAQADRPVEGNVWGLLLQYDCSVVREAQDFQIISKFHSSTTNSNSSWGEAGNLFSSYNGDIADDPRLFTDGNMVVAMLNQTDGSWVQNMQAVIEVGLQGWSARDGDSSTPAIDLAQSSDCYMEYPRNSTGDYPGIDQEQILELALWQRLRIGNMSENDTKQPDYSIDHNITSYFGTWDVQYFKGLSKSDRGKSQPLPMTAIGVKCRASSSVGRADINGLKSRPRWLSSLFKAAAAPPPYSGRAATASTTNDWEIAFPHVHYDTRAQLSFLQAEQLRRTILQAYASYAVSLMYNGEAAYATDSGSQLTFLNPNASEFVSGQVIKPGVMPPLVPLALFCIWALVSSALGVIYGFRRRWTETLDGHTMFRMGAELTDHHRRELLKTSNISKDEDCVVLDDIPALVGDTKPEMWLGRIGLVKDVKADKKKFYE